jgi:hypothetical protein
MATDQTPTANRLIVTITIVSVALLVVIRFALGSYFTQMVEGEQRLKQSAPEEYTSLRAGQQRELTSGPMPIDQAIAQLASKRDSDVIAPKQSEDTTPLTGWAKSPKPLPKLPAPAPVPAVDTGDAGAGEGGALEGGALAAEAGPPHHAAADGGH